MPVTDSPTPSAACRTAITGSRSPAPTRPAARILHRRRAASRSPPVGLPSRSAPIRRRHSRAGMCPSPSRARREARRSSAVFRPRSDRAPIGNPVRDPWAIRVSRTAPGTSRSGLRHREVKRGRHRLPGGSSASIGAGPTFLLAQGPTNVTSSHDGRFVFVPTEGVHGAITCRLDRHRGKDCSDGTFSVSGLPKGTHLFTSRRRTRSATSASRASPGPSTSGRRRSAREAPRPVHLRPGRCSADVEADPALYICTLDGLPDMPCDDKIHVRSVPRRPSSTDASGDWTRR